MNYKRKQQEVTAVQFVDGRHGEAIDFCPELDVSFTFVSREQDKRAVRSPHHARIGSTNLKNGDWIVKQGDTFSLVDDATFQAEFEAA